MVHAALLYAWEDSAGSLVFEKTYRFVNVTVRSYNNIKYVSLSEASSVEEVDDLGDVVELSDEDYDYAVN